MKRRFYILLLIPVTVLLSAGPAPLPLKEQLAAQIQASCREGRKANKSIREIGGALEAHTFNLSCKPKGEKTDEVLIRIADEIAIASEYVYDSPYLHEFFAVTVDGNCTYASRLPERTSKTPLASQIIERNPANGKILYWESHLRKSNLFVDEEYYLRVFFHDDGTYREHFLYIKTIGKLMMGGGVNNEIHMELVPA